MKCLRFNVDFYLFAIHSIRIHSYISIIFMAITKKQKKEVLEKIVDKINKAKAVVFVGYDRVKIVDQDKLRKALKKENGELLVTKKTLLNLALKELKINPPAGGAETLDLEKEVAIVFGYKDEVAPARIVAQIARSAANLKIKGGILENQLVAIEKIKFLSNLPSKEILQAKLLAGLQGSLSGLVNVLQGNLRGLVYVFKAMAEKNN